jgi:hypothetical protein
MNDFLYSSIANQKLKSRIHGLAYSEVIDLLSEWHFVLKPKSISSMFYWFTNLSNQVSADDSVDPHVIILGRPFEFDYFIDAHPDVFFILISNHAKTDAQKWANENRRFLHVAWVEQTDRFMYYLNSLQKAFVDNLVWESTLDYAVYNGSRIDNLLGYSEANLNGFVCATDSGFNLNLYSKSQTPPAPVYSDLIASGGYNKQEIQRLEAQVLCEKTNNLNTPIVCPPCETNPTTNYHFVLRYEGSYLFHLTLATTAPYNEATARRFSKFYRRARQLFISQWNQQVSIESPSHKMLIKLINGEQINKGYLSSQLAFANLQDAEWFRLLRIQLSTNIKQTTVTAVINAAKQLNGGLSCVFAYDDSIVILEYSTDPRECTLSLHRCIGDYISTIYEPFKIMAAASQQFSDIFDIKYAYSQTIECFKNQRCFLGMFPDGPFDRATLDPPMLPFDYILETLAFDSTVDRRILDFTFSNSIVEKLFEEDARENTDIAKLLWVYLSHERNATQTAESLSMHRNTVLYHVRKIEDRFDISLESPRIRDFIHLGYIQHFRRCELQTDSEAR